MPLLHARDIVSGYGAAEIIHGVTLSVAADEIVCLIGPNGAGKSTLIKTLCGVIDAWDGDIIFGGESITQYRPAKITRAGMCYVPQTENVFPNMTVRENLEMGAYILDDVPEHRIQDVFDLFPVLADNERERAKTLSGGQQQMLAMARALMIDPKLLLIDEPSAGLAPDLVDVVFDRITDINANDTAILMVEQNARKALRTSDRGYVLEQGHKRFEDNADALLNNPEIVDLYLGD
ncbi:MAG: ABC transporter ATP-binding protein [Halorhabdus sp.]